MNDEQYSNLMDKMLELQGDFREHKGRTETEIKNIDKKMDKADMWENIKVIGVMPIMAALHHFFGKGQ